MKILYKALFLGVCLNCLPLHGVPINQAPVKSMKEVKSSYWPSFEGVSASMASMRDSAGSFLGSYMPEAPGKFLGNLNTSVNSMMESVDPGGLNRAVARDVLVQGGAAVMAAGAAPFAAVAVGTAVGTAATVAAAGVVGKAAASAASEAYSNPTLWLPVTKSGVDAVSGAVKMKADQYDPSGVLRQKVGEVLTNGSATVAAAADSATDYVSGHVRDAYAYATSDEGRKAASDAASGSVQFLDPRGTTRQAVSDAADYMDPSGSGRQMASDALATGAEMAQGAFSMLKNTLGYGNSDNSTVEEQVQDEISADSMLSEEDEERITGYFTSLLHRFVGKDAISRHNGAGANGSSNSEKQKQTKASATENANKQKKKNTKKKNS